MSKKYFYSDFLKVEDQDDGSIIVKGIASTEKKDSDGEVIKASAVREAIDDYMQFGAVREMHKASAVGTAVSINVDDEGVTHFEAKIVDTEAIKKVRAGVYKGFSIGGKVRDRNHLNKSEITKIKLNEISIVDRPANPDSVFTMVKIDDDDTDEDDVSKAGARFSKRTKECLSSLHKAVKDAQQLLDDLKYEEAEETAEDTQKVDGSEDLKNQISEKDENLAKMQEKLGSTETELKKFQDENDLLKVEISKLKSEVETLKKEPEPNKSFRTETTVVEKDGDVDSVTKSEKQTQEQLPPEGTQERAKYEIRKALKNGVQIG
jgi:phage head maturation protease